MVAGMTELLLALAAVIMIPLLTLWVLGLLLSMFWTPMEDGKTWPCDPELDGAWEWTEFSSGRRVSVEYRNGTATFRRHEQVWATP